MKNPYLILDLWEQRKSLDDKQVKTAYLQAIKKYPPDREPVRFQEIRAAYEQLKTEKTRLQYALFDTTLVDREDLINILLPDSTLQRPNLKTIQRILKESN